MLACITTAAVLGLEGRLVDVQVEPPPAGAMFVGELSLGGQLRHTPGILPMVATARAAGLQQVYVPAEDGAEAALLRGIEVIPVTTLAHLIAHLKRDIRLAAA